LLGLFVLVVLAAMPMAASAAPTQVVNATLVASIAINWATTPVTMNTWVLAQGPNTYSVAHGDMSTFNLALTTNVLTDVTVVGSNGGFFNDGTRQLANPLLFTWGAHPQANLATYTPPYATGITSPGETSTVVLDQTVAAGDKASTTYAITLTATATAAT
jgi:hypothetical protein